MKDHDTQAYWGVEVQYSSMKNYTGGWIGRRACLLSAEKKTISTSDGTRTTVLRSPNT
jgi:hypothetical protein